MVDDQVFVRGKWIEFNSLILNELLNCPDHDDDDYEKLLKDGVQIEKLENKLCQPGKEVPLEEDGQE